MGLNLKELQQAARSKTAYGTSDMNDCESSSIPKQLGICTSSSRVQPLEEALRLTVGDRQNSYGHPTDDFFRTAGMWTALLGLPPGTITPEKVALMMVLLKISREMNKHKQDNLVDMAGYVNCLHMILERKSSLGERLPTMHPQLNAVHDTQEVL